MNLTQRQKQSAVVLVICLAGIGYYATRGGGDQSPEARVRKAVHAMVDAAEARKIAPFKRIISANFQDENQRGKDDTLNLIRAIFLRHQQVSLSVLQLDIASSSNPNVREAHLTLLMSETSMPTDRGEFNLTFRLEDGDWRLWSARWGDGYGY